MHSPNLEKIDAFFQINNNFFLHYLVEFFQRFWLWMKSFMKTYSFSKKLYITFTKQNQYVYLCNFVEASGSSPGYIKKYIDIFFDTILKIYQKL